MRVRVLATYGQNVSGPRLCPGESDCSDWKGTAGATREIKERKVCHDCPAFPTKLDLGKGHKQRQAIVESALQIRNERRSGYPRPLHRMTGIEFQTLLMIDQIVEREEVVLKIKANEMLAAALGLKKAMGG